MLKLDTWILIITSFCKTSGEVGLIEGETGGSGDAVVLADIVGDAGEEGTVAEGDEEVCKEAVMLVMAGMPVVLVVKTEQEAEPAPKAKIINKPIDKPR